MTDELERIRREYIRRDTAGVANVYSYENPAFAFHMEERERCLLRMLSRADVDLTATDVVEIGSGTGHILQRFLDFGARSVLGIELMPHRIAMGQAKYPGLRMVCADGGALPLPSNSFGLVTQFMCLSSVLDSALRGRIASEMWRVLSPRGVILSYDLRANSKLRTAIGYAAQYMKSAGPNNGSDTPIQPFGLDDLRRLFPTGNMDAVSLSLDFNLAAVAGVSRSLASWLSFMPPLRTHWLALIRKPAGIK
jgi:SAM-dependent methyltransferase